MVPEINKADIDLKTKLESWEESTSDFFLASKSKSSYPEYQLFKKAGFKEVLKEAIDNSYSDHFSIVENIYNIIGNVKSELIKFLGIVAV